ncbi:trypsin-like serine protease [Xanthobacter sp. 126]|uniref:S1 family peptidase n=1 Tax=Xanthobacter sp. 126 TaxID=1131814 RepID=UPI00045E7A53|nr:trypsin-like serine protease [Xanthobacter sp. 126]
MKPFRLVAPAPFLALALALIGPNAAQAIVGGGPATADVAAQTVLIVSTRGASCTGTVLARDLVLTAAHCVAPKADYAVAIIGDGEPKLVPAARIAVHPRFDATQFQTRRPTPDLALVKLAAPLPARFRTARLSTASELPEKGASFVLAGYGFIADRAEKSAGTLRAVEVSSIGTTGGIIVRLSLPQGLAGACTGDSGGPAFREGALAGVIGWVTAPGGADGCGGVTGVILVSPHRDWITATAKALGSPLPATGL